jgi:hypothetical protein
MSGWFAIKGTLFRLDDLVWVKLDEGTAAIARLHLGFLRTDRDCSIVYSPAKEGREVYDALVAHLTTTINQTPSS